MKQYIKPWSTCCVATSFLFAAVVLAGCREADTVGPLNADDGLQGTWRQILLNDEGKRFIKEDEFLKWDSKCTITNRNIIWQSGVRRNVSVLPYTLDTTKTPHWIDWQASNGRAVTGILKQEGDTLKICVGRVRPLDFDPTGSPSENLFVFRRSDLPPVEPEAADNVQLDSTAASFEKASINKDKEELQRVRAQYYRLNSENKVDRFTKFLDHENLEVRMQTLLLFSEPEPGHEKIRFAGPMLQKLLEMVGNEKLSDSERRNVVAALLQDYEDNRKRLYAKLSELGSEGHFAIPELAAFIADKEHRHWSSGGAFDAPTGAVELLGAWGSKSAEAIPSLIVAIDHPNQWDFVPIIAETLGAIGQESQAAKVALRRLQKSKYPKASKAATEALERIIGD